SSAYGHVVTVHIGRHTAEVTMRSHKGAILATVCAAVLAIHLAPTIVTVALPSISRELSAGTRSLQWVVDAYNLAFAGLVLAAGSLPDRFGGRRAMNTRTA